MEQFPNTTVYDGSAPGMNSQHLPLDHEPGRGLTFWGTGEFYSYCFESYVPPTADLYLVELDINNVSCPTRPSCFEADAIASQDKSAAASSRSA